MIVVVLEMWKVASLLLLIFSMASAEICPIEECDICLWNEAVCRTNSSTEPIPQNLRENTTYITIKWYSGPPLELTPAMFRRYSNLSNLFLSGNFVGIASQTFANLPLKLVSITHTNISVIAPDAFGSRTILRELFLSYNKFTAFPVSIFKSLFNIIKLDFSFNPIEICSPNITSIGKEFEQMNKLSHLYLSGIGSSHQSCPNIGADFFAPISHLSYVLNATDSCLFTGNLSAVQYLRRMQVLDLSSVYPFTECPARVKGLLDNLPKSSQLRILYARDWRTYNSIPNVTCTIVPETIQGLNSTRSKVFKRLDFERSDMALGKTLPDDMFVNMNTLQEVNLGFAGLEKISDNALRGVDIITLSLDGNPFGTRTFNLGHPQQTFYIKSLSLSNVGIRSDGKILYNLYSFLNTLPYLETLDISHNLIADLPCFIFESNPLSSKFHIDTCVAIENNSSKHTHLSSIDLSGNLLTKLGSDRMESACRQLPQLQTFTAESNRLSDISGLCTSIEELYLKNNIIGYYPQDTFPRLKQLANLKRVDLSFNSIKFLPSDIFEKMKSLSWLIIQGNPISALPDSIFAQNSQLDKVDLSNCFLVDFGATIDAVKILPKLKYLYIKYNQYKTFVPSAVRVVEHELPSLKSLSIIGNPFDCDCHVNQLQDWLRSSNTIIDVKNISCGGPEDSADARPVYSYQPPPFKCKIQLPLIIAGAALGCLLLLLLLCSPCIRLRWFIARRKVVFPALKEALREIRHSHSCLYDAYICYDSGSDTDTQWVGENLVPNLEGTDHQANQVIG